MSVQRWWCLTSGIVDDAWPLMGRAWLVLLVSSDVGVERGVWLVGVGLAHCWVLKHQAPRVSASACVVGVGGSGSSLCFAAPVGVVGGWWGCCLRSA